MDRSVMMVRLILSATLLLTALSGPSLAADDAGQAFGGVGLQVVPTVDGHLVVLRVVADTPAAQEDIKPGDLIYRVDDFNLKGSEFGSVVANHLWGPVGSVVTLSFHRPGVQGNKTVHLRRIPMKPQLTVTPAVKEQDPALNMEKRP